VTDCADENGTCLAGDYGSTSQLTYYNDSGSDIAAYLICDSNSSGSYGTYDLTIDLSSIPDGYSCDYAHLITSSGTYSSDTTDLEDNYQLPYSGSCLGTSTYTDGRDEVWEVQIPAGQKLTAILDPSSGWLSYGRFYVITDCADPDGTCLDGDYGSYLEVSYGPVVSDTTVYLVVDSYSTSYDGPYDLLVTIEVPPPGPTCGEPVVVNVPGDLPYSETGGTTCGMDDDYYLTCLSSYDGGEDTIYEIVVSSATTVTFTMDPGTTSYIGMALDDTCPPALSGCVATDTSSSSTDLTFTESLSVGTYYLMLDTWPSPDCIPSYNLTITE